MKAEILVTEDDLATLTCIPCAKWNELRRAMEKNGSSLAGISIMLEFSQVDLFFKRATELCTLFQLTGLKAWQKAFPDMEVGEA